MPRGLVLSVGFLSDTTSSGSSSMDQRVLEALIAERGLNVNAFTHTDSSFAGEYFSASFSSPIQLR